MDAEGRLDPYFHHVSHVEETVNLFDASVWSLRDLIRNVETSRKLHLDPSKPPKPDFEQLHEISRHMIHSSETLKSAMNALGSMIRSPQSSHEIAQQRLLHGKSKHPSSISSRCSIVSACAPKLLERGFRMKSLWLMTLSLNTTALSLSMTANLPSASAKPPRATVLL
ncbi:hypothetical protein BJ546DRAFT_306440 [Cryomyces antarcticus]